MSHQSRICTVHVTFIPNMTFLIIQALYQMQATNEQLNEIIWCNKMQRKKYIVP